MPVTPSVWLSPVSAPPNLSGFQSHSRIIGLSNGNILVVFADDNATTAPGTGRDVVGVIYDATGAIVRPGLQLNSSQTTRSEEAPSISATSDGGFVMVYEAIDGGSTNLVAERYNAAGVSIDSIFVKLDISATVTLNNPVVAVDPADNSFLVTYEQLDGTTHSIVSREYDASLNLVGSEQTVRGDSFADGVEGNPAANDTAVLASGRYVTVFQENDLVGGVNTTGIEFRLSDLNGIPAANTAVAAQGLAPKVAALSDGGFAVAWARTVGGVGFVEFSIYNANGSIRVSLGTAASGADGGQFDIIGLEDGTFAVVLRNATTLDYRAAVFDNTTGLLEGDIATISAPSNVSGISLGTTTDGRILLSYQTSPNAGDVRYQILDSRDGFIQADITDGQVTATLNGAVLLGSIASERLIGRGGNDTFRYDQSTTSAGNIDTIDGGLGDNTFQITSTAALLVDLTAGVYALGDINATGATRGLLSNILNVEVSGAQHVRGDGLANTLIGVGSSANYFQGMAGTDTLIGGDGDDTLEGGQGIDRLEGGLGNDTYVDPTAEELVEAAGEGTDTILSQVTFDLLVPVNFENLTLTGSAESGGGSAAANVIRGNAIANFLVGRGGDDTLFGEGGGDTLDGGSGNDTLAGGLGNDVYQSPDPFTGAGDTIVEASGEGIDTILSSVTFSLAAVANVENLTLEGVAGINAVGNNLGNVLTGNAGENLLQGLDGEDTLDGAGGHDLLEGGNDSDRLIGGSGNDTLRGGLGFDTLDGGQGADVLEGGADNDVYLNFDLATDSIVELVNGGTDTVVSTGSFSIESLAEVENLTLQGALFAGVVFLGTGNTLNNVITGDARSDNLSGLAGRDTLLGADGDDTLDGGSDNDLLIGGFGNDAYFVDSIGDFVSEGSSEGTDTVFSSISYDITVFLGIENITLGGDGDIDATGNIRDNTILGNARHNRLSGDSGFDTILGGGGDDTISGFSGADLFVGGTGNDTYSRLAAGTIITELAGEGVDTIEVVGGFSLAGIANVENLTMLTPAFSIDIVMGAGNELGNLITGTEISDSIEGAAGNDTLQGRSGSDALLGGEGDDTIDGGASADTLMGGVGNDTYVGPAGDVIAESAGEGFDTIESAVTASLAASPNVEAIRLTGVNGVNAAGNAGDNALTGNGAANILNGAAGVDTMTGGAGNDTYYVDRGGDLTIELSAGGTDLVSSSISRTLSVHVENLNLSGTANIDGNGNTAANIINGNAGNNILRGDAGSDRLNGAAGNDLLLGGTSSDTLVPGVDADRDVVRFSAVGDSTGSQRDIVIGFDLNAEDRLDFTAVPASLSFVTGGVLSLATINANLATAVDAALAINGAVVFDPSGGDLNQPGHVFLVVDVNGDGVYRPNQDYVVQLINPTGAFTLDDFI